MDTLEMPVVEPDRPLTSRSSIPNPRRRRYRWSPQDRPPAGARMFVGLLGFAAMLITAALLLSDRAPSALRTVFGERARRLWARIDAGNRVDVPTGTAATELTQADFLVHVTLWAIIAVLVGVAIWTWRGLAMAAGVLAASSVALELAQGRFATTRSVEATDAAANLVGIALGTAAAAACYLAWSAAAALRRRL